RAASLRVHAPGGPKSERRSRVRCRRTLRAPLSRDFENRFDFDRDIARQRRCAYRCPGMPPRLAEDLHEKIGGAVDDLGMLRESGPGIDETGDLHHAPYSVEV